MTAPGKTHKTRSIFRKTAIIFVVVALVPIAILGLRNQHIYTDQLNKMVQSGVLTGQEADSQTHEMEVQAIAYGVYGLVIALILGYFFASSLVRPIRVLQQGARRIGGGNLDYRVETNTEDELEDLAMTINQMADSLQARESEISRRNRDLAILYDIAHHTAESRELNSLMDHALEKTMAITGASFGCILLSGEEGKLEPVICRGTTSCKMDEPPGEFFGRTAMAATRAGAPAVFDFQDDGATDGQNSLAALACVPLKSEGILQGALCVSGSRSDFTQDTLDLISAIGSEVAMTLENARLFEKLEVQNQELALATDEIGNLISRAEEQKSFGTRYQNPNLVRCWEFKDCEHDRCPAYGVTENLRCWQVAGTHCDCEVQDIFAQKLGRCEHCEVFAAACPDRITQLGETFNNMMAVLERHVEEQEELQHQLYSSSKLAAIGELAAGVAHEINNPLTGILGSALLMKSQPLDPEDMKNKLAIIESETLQARDIVRNLLDFAHQGGDLNPAPASITKLLEHTLSLVRHQADLGRIEVETDIQDNLPDVAVDANQMKQVFLNIINNAVQSMPGGGRLVITARRSTSLGERRALETGFADTGTVMDAESMRRVFDPFFTTKRVGEGTGLGLSISRRIVNNHGGKILVASAPGAGSTFTVVLPAVEEPAKE